MTPYQTIRQLAENHGYSTKTVRTIVREIKAQIERGRYPPETIIDGGKILINAYAWYDYLHYRLRLKHAPQYVPPYDVAKWVKQTGGEYEEGDYLLRQVRQGNMQKSAVAQADRVM